MKRLWVGVAFLGVLLALGILVTAAFARFHYPLADKLEQASETALAEDWAGALEISRSARNNWERFRRFTAMLADHEPLEEMDSLFRQLQVWERLGEREEFAATCAQLAVMARAMADSQAITWWNLL